jgi:hypothetical protein
MTDKNRIDLRTNGRLFPLWILQNFKKYKLDPYETFQGNDPCNVVTEQNDTLRKYQAFISSFLDYKTPYHNILIYHGLGAGKTAAAINVYNILYNYNPGWNVYILIKASLKDDPWLKDIKSWLSKDDYKERYDNIQFIHYDDPNADKKFLTVVRESDATKKNIYIFDEAHNFIKNVYNNIITKTGKRALTIYDYIIQEKKENDSTRVILLSGTPAVNKPYELVLIFNLLRPDIFPKSEAKFNEIYILKTFNKHILNPETKNMFQRRILGLVSYYIGADPLFFASKVVKFKDIKMDKYQIQVYEHYEYIEEQLEKKNMKNNSSQKVYKSYTRQASNFVFPFLGGAMTGENRPRPSRFKLTEQESEYIITGKTEEITQDKNKKKNVIMYLQAITLYIETFKNHLKNIEIQDKKKNNTLQDDIRIYKNEYKYNFYKFWEGYEKKSELLKTLYSCSCKMIAIIFNIMKSNGPVLVFSNFVKMEGLEIFKIYLSFFGFSDFHDKQTNDKDNEYYTEFHGEIERQQRVNNLYHYNLPTNINGAIIKIILISPAGSEGINLMNVRQVHILEPYWNEVRITQLIGRAIRMCSHKALPMEERKVKIYRYHAIRDGEKITTDQSIYNTANEKEILINSFLNTIKEAAIDCELFKNHNMNNCNYSCFKFNEKSYFDKYIGPAYKEDIYYDKKIDNGLNAINSVVKKIKVVKIKGVMKIDDDLQEVDEYWYNPETCVVYDKDLDFPVGRVLKEYDIPKKIEKDVYLIEEIIYIPKINKY